MARTSEALCRRDRSLSAAGLRFMPAAVVARRNRNCLQLVLVASSLSPVATVRALWPPGAQRKLPMVRSSAAIRSRGAVGVLDAGRSGIEYRPRTEV